MFKDNHLYRLLDENKRTLASAETMADVRSMTGYLFERYPEITGIDVYAWNSNARATGYAFVQTILRPKVQLAPAA